MRSAVGRASSASNVARMTLALAAPEKINHLPTHVAVRAECTVLRELGGGCHVPIS
jgi:porphobilinogen deaminase